MQPLPLAEPRRNDWARYPWLYENAEVVWRAVRLYRASAADFVDCLIERSAAAAGCLRTMSFDRGAVKNCAMILLE